MSPKKLGKIRKQLTALRASPQGIQPRLLISIAKALGRVPHARGKEPAYVSNAFSRKLPPLTIPNHAVLKVGTACSIIDMLLGDVDTWQEHFDEESDEMDSEPSDDDG